MIPDVLKIFLKSELKEIHENKLRFAALIILLLAVVILSFNNTDSGEEIILTAPPPAETSNAEQKIIPVANTNITAVIGANSGDLYVYNPFKVEPKFELEPVEIPTPEPEIIQLPDIPILPPPVAQELPKSIEKFILRGTAIIGENKSALIQKSANSSEENLILNIGDTLQGKIIIDIAQDSLTFNDGTKLFLNLDDQ